MLDKVTRKELIHLREQAMPISGGRTLQAEYIASAKALRQECARVFEEQIGVE